MTTTFMWNGIEYFENHVIAQSQYRDAVKLANNFLYSVDEPITERDITEFIEADPDGNEAWLLSSFDHPLIPISPLANTSSVIQSGRVKAHQRYGRAGRTVCQQEALLLLRAYVKQGCLWIDVDAFCRDPWSDVALCAYWADRRLRAASEALGGANELRLFVTETDTPLQRELKKLGYFCFDVDKATGDYQFSKILSPRSRNKFPPFSGPSTTSPRRRKRP